MRFDSILDATYVLSSLWSGVPGAGGCVVSPRRLVRASTDGVGRPALVMAFVDVHVVPMDTERVLPHQTVLVEGGKITALGPMAKVPVPVDAVRIDGRGKYLMPGLGHGHDHETERDLQGLAVQGNSAVASPTQLHALGRNLGEGVTAVAAGVEHLPVVRRFLQTVPSPNFYAAASVPASVRRQGLDSMAAYLVVRKAAGDAYIDGEGKDTLLIAAAARASLPVTWHADGHPNRDMFADILRLGRARGAVEHLQFYEDSIDLGFTSDSPQAGAWQRLSLDQLRPKMQTLAAAIRRAGVYVTPTLRCQIGYAGYLPAADPRVAHPLNVFLAKFELQFTKVLHDAGVPLLLSADDNWSSHDELTAFVQAGLTPYQALVAGTRNLAEYFGQLDSVGTVTVGKRADLLLLTGNPLQDIRHVREPVGVMVNGRWLDRATLDQLLLAFPELWLQWVLRGRGDPIKFQQQKSDIPQQLGGEPGQPHRVALLTLIDSLALAPPVGVEHERLTRRVAAALGRLRALLPPEQQRAWLDPAARMWMRLHARQGYHLTISGVTPIPAP